jgi:hypothetical protein
MKKLKVETDKGFKELEYEKQFGEGIFVLYDIESIKNNSRELKIDLRGINKMRYSARNPIVAITVMLPDEHAQFIVTPGYHASDLSELVLNAPEKIKKSVGHVHKSISLIGFLNAFTLS